MGVGGFGLFYFWNLVVILWEIGMGFFESVWLLISFIKDWYIFLYDWWIYVLWKYVLWFWKNNIYKKLLRKLIELVKKNLGVGRGVVVKVLVGLICIYG